MRVCVCVSQLCVGELCVRELCVSKLCVRELCVSKLCVSSERVKHGAGGGREEEEEEEAVRTGVRNHQTRTPHKDAGKNAFYMFGMVFPDNKHMKVQCKCFGSPPRACKTMMFD